MPPHYLELELNDRVQSDATVFEFLQRGSLDGLWYWDLENPEDEWMSPEFWKLFGIDPTTKAHKAEEWQDLIFPEDRDLALENFRLHCADPDHPYDQVVRYRHADGSTVWVRCRGMAFRNEQGVPTRMLGAHTDITALKATEAELQAQVAETEEANADLVTFAYALSHDLRAPVNSLQTVLQHLDEELGSSISPDARDLLDRGLATVGRTSILIKEILDYTQTVGQVVEMETVDLGLLVDQVLSDLGDEISADGVTIDVGELIEVQGSPTQLRLLLQNLISNAVKFRDPGGTHTVTVRTEKTPDGSRIRVADTGIGIPEDKRDQIYDLFGRLHLRSRFPGNGIGLALCQRIVTGHRGSITVQSQLGRGSEFIVDLPGEPPA